MKFGNLYLEDIENEKKGRTLDIISFQLLHNNKRFNFGTLEKLVLFYLHFKSCERLTYQTMQNIKVFVEDGLLSFFKTIYCSSEMPLRYGNSCGCFQHKTIKSKKNFCQLSSCGTLFVEIRMKIFCTFYMEKYDRILSGFKEINMHSMDG